MITKDFIPDREQRLVNGLLSPRTIDDFWDSWIDEGKNYIKSYIDITQAEEGQIDLWLKYYIQYRMYETTELEDIPKDKKISLDNMLRAVRENQIIGLNPKNTEKRVMATSGTSVFEDSVFKDGN